MSLMDERDDTYRYVAPVQSVGFVEGRLPEIDGASTTDNVRLECDSGGGQAIKTSYGKRK